MRKTSPVLLNLIKSLQDKQFHTGTELGEKLGVSRNAICKHINSLQELGFDIITDKKLGYQLNEALMLLDTKNIKKYLNTSSQEQIKKIEIFSEIDSTNNYLRRILPTLSLQTGGIICVAESQSAGRGRLGRNWHSPFARNIYFSLAWCLHKDISELGGLSSMVALSIIKTLEKLNIKDLHVKWPNDVLWQNKKLAGVLIDINAENHGMTHAIIGIGLNVNMPEKVEKKITQAWAALSHLSQQNFDRNILVAELTNQLIIDIQQFEKDGFSSFIKDWKKFDLLYGKKITVEIGEKSQIGQAVGISTQGHLLLKLPNGDTKACSSGDTSILKK